MSLTVYGGMVTEMAAADLPEGVSPDCQDVEFVPGSVFSRRALQKVFATPFGTVTVTYSKSFVTPTGQIWNLYLDSAGNIWKEDVSNNPGVAAMLVAVQAATYAKSITAFGREYIAINDCLHGADVPLQWDGTNLDRVTQDGPGAPPTVANLSLPSVAGSASPTLSRIGNIVTATTATAHGLQVGYQVQISNLGAQPINTIASIVVNNENSPGIATVTLSAAHGLSVGNFVTIAGVVPENIGGGVNSWSLSAGVLTVATAGAHNLSVGAICTLTGLASAGPSGTMAVVQVPTTNTVVFSFPGFIATGSSGGGAGGQIEAVWPSTDDTLFEIETTPTTTSFTVQLSYSDATWDNNGGGAFGGVFMAWDGVFYVATVPSPTTFTYQQIGAPGNTNSNTPSIGTITPFGQIAPGQHQCQVIFLTRAGQTTRPSPPAQILAPGGQYLQVTNIPIGPPNVVARILAFTGAGGAYYFYLPTIPQVLGQIVGTATQINDNTTTSITLDFGDNTLFSGLGIDIPGNTLANQIVIDGALGFGLYAGRLFTWGQRNRIQNLLNLGFEGGEASPPLGWAQIAAGGALVAGRVVGRAYQVTLGTGAGTIQQSFYQDAYGAPIATPNSKYTFRAWLNTNNGGLGSAQCVATISSAGTGFSSTVSLRQLSNLGGFVQGNFNNAMPSAIPSDLILTISTAAGTSTTITIDEMSIIYTQTPFLDGVMYGSYADNPEAFDGVSGKCGASQDTHKIMDIGVIRQTGYLFTQDPGGRLHQFSDNGQTEPAGWTFGQVAANCGLLSAFALTKSQGDDSSASGGEEFLAWVSAGAIRIFGGDQPWKISQEIQPDIDSISTATALEGPYANTPAYLTCWALNDPAGRQLYFGLPINVSVSLTTANPNRVYVCSYRELDSAYTIGNSPPIHVSFTGRLIATDHTRKWTRWNMTHNGAALVYRAPSFNVTAIGLPSLSVLFCGGDGNTLGGNALGNKGNAYLLSSDQFTDDDYGLIVPYYTTYFLVSHDQEQQLSYQLANGQRQPLGAGRKLLQYLSMFIGAPAGSVNTSVLTVSFLVDSLTNAWPLSHTRNLVVAPTFDQEFGGGSTQGQRIAIKIATAPIVPATSKDNGFVLQHLTAWLRQARLPIRGAAS